MILYMYTVARLEVKYVVGNPRKSKPLTPTSTCEC